MSNKNYEICCIIPTKNQSKFLRTSIDSILNQTFKNFHLIVVDNNSTDKTPEILQEYKEEYENSEFPKVTITKELNPGTGAALNKGLKINNETINCPKITWWASDNYLNENTFYELNKFLNENPDIDMCYSNMNIHVVDKTGLKVLQVKNLQQEVGSQEWNPEKIFVNYFLGCIWLFRSSINKKAGEWYIHEPCEDYDQVIRFVFTNAKLKYLDKNLGWFRRHDENLSAKLRNTGYAENLVQRMIDIKNKNLGKQYIEYVRWKYNPDTYLTRKNYNFELFRENINKEKNYFTKVYKNNIWGGKESISGKGSDMEQTKRIINRIPHLVKKYNIESIIDIGCGDLNWMEYVLDNLPGVKYTGIDIVNDLIGNNKQRFPLHEFYNFNVLEKNIDDFAFDLIVCRDVLVHLSNNSILSFLYKVANSDCKYLLTTNFPRYDRNNLKDIDHSKGITWRTINLTRSPFSLIDPVDNINERCTQIDVDGTDFKDKSLALWKVSDIRKSLNLVKSVRHKQIFFKNSRLKKNSKIENVWHLKRIKKVINFYWGNKYLPYLRYLTIKTFSILNPDWEIRFYFPANPSDKITWVSEEHKYTNHDKKNNYLKELKRIKNIKFIKINDENFKHYPEVFKSDLLRWNLLSKESGVWSDMDIIFIRSMNECNFNNLKNENVNTGVQICDGYKETYHTIGFMISGGNNNQYFNYIKEKVKKQKVNFNNYQSIGVCLLNDEFPHLQKIQNKFKNLDIINIDKDLFYNFYPLDRIQELYKENGKDYTNKNTIGIHWYGGYQLSGEFCFEINHENLWGNKSLLSKKIQDVLKLEK